MYRGPAGGYVFKTGDWEQLDRFLILGTEGGTYYAGEGDLTRANAEVVGRCLKEDPERTIDRIAEVSVKALAPKNDYAILAMALSFCEKSAPTLARRDALALVCRTGTHLFQFLEMVKGMRGGGRSLNGSVRYWLDNREVGKLAYQMVKYRQREGWTWRDVMRRFRPKPPSEQAQVESDLLGAEEIQSRRLLYEWASGKPVIGRNYGPIVQAFTVAQSCDDPEKLAAHIRQTKLPWECVPSGMSSNPIVLDALFDNMPMMATVRQLSKLQAHGVLEGRMNDAIARLTNVEQVKKSRIHPVALMLAGCAYEKGQGRNLTWTPDPRIVDALDDAFQLALKDAEPSGKTVLVAVDVSGSMHPRYGGGTAMGIPLFHLAGGMALTHVRLDNAQCIAFDYEGGAHERKTGRYWDGTAAKGPGVYPLVLSGRMRSQDAMRAIEAIGAGGATDCSLPFVHALKHKIRVDAFVVYTDNEGWTGRSHPSQALQEYRNKVNPNAKVVWCAMTAGGSSLGDPEDSLMLSIAGFDSSAPKLISDFVADRF